MRNAFMSSEIRDGWGANLKLGRATAKWLIMQFISCPVWTAPLDQGVFRSVVKVSGAVMSTACLRWVFPAGPDGSSAWLFAAITVARSHWRRHDIWLPSLSVFSHHFVGALDSLPPRAAPAASGGDGLTLIDAASAHQREDEAGELVGERDRRQLEAVFFRPARQQRLGPVAQRVVMALTVAKN